VPEAGQRHDVREPTVQGYRIIYPVTTNAIKPGDQQVGG